MNIQEKIEFVSHYDVVYLDDADKYLATADRELLQYYTKTDVVTLSSNERNVMLNDEVVPLCHKELQDIVSIVDKLLQVLVDRITKSEVVRIREAKAHELLRKEMTKVEASMGKDIGI